MRVVSGPMMAVLRIQTVWRTHKARKVCVQQLKWATARERRCVRLGIDFEAAA